MSQITIEQAFNFAVTHHNAERFVEAEHIYRQILAVQPNHPSALHNLALIANEDGRKDLAQNLLRQAISANPNFAEAYNSLGNCLCEAGKHEEAIAAYRKSIELRPGIGAYNNLADALREIGQVDHATIAQQQATMLAGSPNTGPVGTSTANAAVEAWQRNVAMRPGDADALNNLGNSLKAAGRVADAIATYRQAISLKPESPEAHFNLGLALFDEGEFDEASDEYRAAIVLRPNYSKAYGNLGNALKDTGLLDEAIEAYQKSISLDPDNQRSHSNVLLALHYHPTLNARTIADAHRRWNESYARPLWKAEQSDAIDRTQDRRLRIGYVSPDFRDHAVCRFILPLLGAHDHVQFEIFCYSNSVKSDRVTQEVKRFASTWREIFHLSDDQAAELFRQDKIDVLIDLALHTADNRLMVFARKPAPLQVSYLGYAGSSGLSAIDYRISDPNLDPPEADLSIYSEKTARLAETYWCYQPTSNLPVIPAPILKNGICTFGCLNNFCKINDPLLDLWANVLRRAANSRLILHAPPGKSRQHVLDRFNKNGIALQRIEFVPKLKTGEYHRLYQSIDIALDTFPFAGGTTSCDALWMGVPVVTLAGPTAISRAGACFLTNLRLTELIAHTADEYAVIAAGLAFDSARLQQLRFTMRTRMQESPLMKAKRFAGNFEAAIREMWRQWCRTGE